MKWFNGTKGYGFITLENGGDAFCHASALQAAGTRPASIKARRSSAISRTLHEACRSWRCTASTTARPTHRGGGGGGGGVRYGGGGGGAGGRPRRPRRDFGGGGGGRFGGGHDRFGGGGHDRFGGGGDRFGGGGGDRFGGGGGGHRDRDSGPSGPMVEGKVKFFNDQKGFGFVMPDSGSGDVYVHASALRRSGVQVLEPEQRIRYSTRQGQKGVEVDRVEVL